MHRMQLLEIEDQPWVPAPIRNAMTGGLRVAAQVFGHADAIAAHLAERVEASGCTQLIDLCAGGGGPTIAALEAMNPPAYLPTAKFPVKVEDGWIYSRDDR